jgi:hypothetical protein
MMDIKIATNVPSLYGHRHGRQDLSVNEDTSDVDLYESAYQFNLEGALRVPLANSRARQCAADCSSIDGSWPPRSAVDRRGG